MNRRDMLASVVGAVPVLGNADKIVVGDSGNPIIVLHVDRHLDAIQWRQLRESAANEEKRIGCRIVLCPKHITPTLVSSSPYFMREKVKDYELEVHCQSHDELKEWMS